MVPSHIITASDASIYFDMAWDFATASVLSRGFTILLGVGVTVVLVMGLFRLVRGA